MRMKIKWVNKRTGFLVEEDEKKKKERRRRK